MSWGSCFGVVIRDPVILGPYDEVPLTWKLTCAPVLQRQELSRIQVGFGFMLEARSLVRDITMSPGAMMGEP